MRAILRLAGPGIVAAILLPACSSPGWHRVEGGLFACHVESGMEPELAEILAVWTAEDLPALAALVGQPVSRRRLEIYCGTPRHEGGLVRTLNGEVGRYISGSAPVGRIELVAKATPTALRATLRHEMVHHLLQDTGYAEWLNEGLAEFAAYELAEHPSSEDLHHLLHTGPVLAAWGPGLTAELEDGTPEVIHPDSWLPDLPDLLRMDYADYEREVLQGSTTLRPEFHAVGHLLVRVLLERGGASAPAHYSSLVAQGADPWDAFRILTGLADREAVLKAMTAALDEAVAQHPRGQAVLRSFVHSRCLRDCLPESSQKIAWRLGRLQAYPHGDLVPFQP